MKMKRLLLATLAVMAFAVPAYAMPVARDLPATAGAYTEFGTVADDAFTPLYCGGGYYRGGDGYYGGGYCGC